MPSAMACPPAERGTVDPGASTLSTPATALPSSLPRQCMLRPALGVSQRRHLFALSDLSRADRMVLLRLRRSLNGLEHLQACVAAKTVRQRAAPKAVEGASEAAGELPRGGAKRGRRAPRGAATLAAAPTPVLRLAPAWLTLLAPSPEARPNHAAPQHHPLASLSHTPAHAAPTRRPPMPPRLAPTHAAALPTHPPLGPQAPRPPPRAWWRRCCSTGAAWWPPPSRRRSRTARRWARRRSARALAHRRTRATGAGPAGWPGARRGERLWAGARVLGPRLQLPTSSLGPL